MVKKSLLVLILSCLHGSYFYSYTPSWYQHQSAILTNQPMAANSQEVQPLDPAVETLAQEYFDLLSVSKFFETKKLSDYSWIQEQFSQEPHCFFHEIELTTDDGERVSCSYFDRGNDTVVIVGPGFTNPAEKMAPFIHILAHYDVAIINYRGHSAKTPLSINPFQLFLYKIFNVTTETRLGAIEEHDVFALVDFFRNKLGYKKVIGLGLCYSTLIFAKAQALHEQGKVGRDATTPLFDKLIMDSTWLSLEKFCEKLGNDPKLIFTPQRGGWSKNWFVKRGFTKNFFPFLTKAIIALDVKRQKAISSHLPAITKAPLLFFYGKNDLTVTRDEFEAIWNAASNTDKTTIITSNPHVINHIKQKELYALIVELFIDIDRHDQFINHLCDPSLISDFILKKNQEKLTKKKSPQQPRYQDRKKSKCMMLRKAIQYGSLAGFGLLGTYVLDRQVDLRGKLAQLLQKGSVALHKLSHTISK